MLGLKPKHIAFRLVLFASGASYPYRGSKRLFKQLYGTRILGAKLELDCNDVFDKVIPPSHGFRPELLAGYKALRDLSFFDVRTDEGREIRKCASYQRKLRVVSKLLAEHPYKACYAQEVRHARILAGSGHRYLYPLQPFGLLNRRSYDEEFGAHMLRSITRVTAYAQRISITEEEARKMGWWSRCQWRIAKSRERHHYIVSTADMDKLQTQK